MPSPPTSRVLDVIELLAEPADRPLRLADIVRELNLTQATAHSILTTLCARGWVTRDPVDKTFSPGPSLSAAAARADAARSWTHAAREAALRLVDELGVTVTVSERAGESLVVTALEEADHAHDLDGPGRHFPFAAPFGSVFAAWNDTAERASWIARAGLSDGELATRLIQILDSTKDRGFAVERMTPLIAHAAALMGALQTTQVVGATRKHLEELIANLTADGLATSGTDQRSDQPVTTIAAPVFDRRGRAVLCLSAHPLRALSAKQVHHIGARLMRETDTISRSSSHDQLTYGAARSGER